MFNQHFQKNDKKHPLQNPPEKETILTNSSDQKLSDFRKDKKQTQLNLISDFENSNFKTVKNNILLNEPRELEISTEPETRFSETCLEVLLEQEFISPTFQLQNLAISNFKNTKNSAFKNSHNDCKKTVNENKTELVENINDTLKKPKLSSFDNLKSKFELDSFNSNQFKFAGKNNEFLKKLFVKNEEDFLKDEVLDSIQESFLNAEKNRNQVIFTTPQFWIFRLLENSQANKIKSVFLTFRNLKVISNKNKELSIFLNRFVAKKTTNDFLSKSLFVIFDFAKTKTKQFSIKSQKMASLKNFSIIYRFKNLSNLLFTFSKLKFSFKKISSKSSDSNYIYSSKLTFVSIQSIFNLKTDLHKKYSFNLLVSLNHKRQLSISTKEARKSTTSMAKIVKQLNSIDQKIGILKSDFKKNEENVQEIRKITEKTSKNQISKIENQINSFRNKNKSSEKLVSPLFKTAALKISRKTVAEAFQEQNFNLAKFLENQRLTTGFSEQNIDNSKKKSAKNSNKIKATNNPDSSKIEVRIGSEILPKREFLGIRDIYFS